METVEIYDPVAQQRYHLQLNKSYAERVKQDAEFAKALINHAMVASGKASNEASQKGTANNDVNSVPKFIEVWTHDETINLINTVEKNKDMYFILKKRTQFWDSISRELAALGTTKSGLRCQGKWKTLIRSYRSTKDKTYNKFVKFRYQERMHKILASKPSPSCVYIPDDDKTNNSEENENDPIAITNEDDPIALSSEDDPSVTIQKADSNTNIKFDDNVYKKENVNKIFRLDTTQNDSYQEKLDQDDQITKEQRKRRKWEIISKQLELDERRCRIAERRLLLREKKSVRSQKKHQEKMRLLRKQILLEEQNLQLEERKVVAMEEFVAMLK